MADWYYIGHYGQLGPLTIEQMEDLIAGGVIGRDTYVWKGGMSDWVLADRATELAGAFTLTAPVHIPPPPPSPLYSAEPPMPRAVSGDFYLSSPDPNLPMGYGIVRSDRNRAIAGVLQFFPGVGRMYLGYWAHGVLQLIFAMCGVGFLWSWIDGLIILAGGIKLDGYGRRLPG